MRPTRRAARRWSRPILVIAPDVGGRGEYFSQLDSHFVPSVVYFGAVAHALASSMVRTAAAVVVAPCVPPTELDALLTLRNHDAPGLPVLVLRGPRAEVPQAWEGHSVGVLRLPLLPDGLTRSLEGVLGLRLEAKGTPSAW